MQRFEKYSGYKDSGVDWIGDIPAGWEIKKLKYISNIKTGYTPLTSQTNNFSEDGMIWVKPDNLNGHNPIFDSKEKISENGIKNQNIIPEKSLLVCCIGTIGKFGIAGVDLVTNQQINSITFHSSVCADYGKYLISTCESEFSKWANGNVVRILNTSTQGNIYFPLPPLPEQTAIANFLDEKTTKIDTAIAQKEQMISLLKERKQILIQNAVTKGIDPDAQMKDSGVDWIGKIPVGWKILPNKALFQESKAGGNDTLPLLSVSLHSGISSGELGEEENIRGKVKIEDKSSYKLVRPHYIAYNMMRAWQGAIGAVAVDGMVSPAYVVAIPNEILINTVYFELQYRTSSFIQQMNRFSKGITDFRKRLYWNEFKQLNTIVPPLGVQQEIVDFIETQSAKINTSITLQQQQITKLKEYKSILIDHAVTGKIKVA
ncbi:MAG: restriction endonuclease subunit S [Candidatus Electrothrix sp. GM3_4]|nr:restriction endonuclease subunit S [Candidatus Electrothrix sp. GM3_4]